MICSHNTFTYMKPEKWWMYLFKPFAQCQIGDLLQQDFDIADVRIKKVKDKIKVCHGLVTYCDFEKVLETLPKFQVKQIRVIVEGKYDTDFILEIQRLLEKYPEIQIYEFRDKKTWKQILPFPTLEITQLVGSMQSWYGKILPALYYLFNKKLLDILHKECSCSCTIYSFDFL